MQIPNSSDKTRPATSDANGVWDSFDSSLYFQQNYGRLLREDATIIRTVADHFQKFAQGGRPAHAIDVGSGTNLYPALTMLPFAERVTLSEKAGTNRAWLTRQLDQPAESWRQFWLEMLGRDSYDRVTSPFATLSARATVEEGDVFDLGKARYGIGTMFFVAESTGARIELFERALAGFVGSLAPEAPFAAAFMRESQGCDIGGTWFPACAITEADVERGLAGIARIDTVAKVESHLRDGHNGMIVATGRAERRGPDR